jgi:GDPmannose 4,6-dehydratase
MWLMLQQDEPEDFVVATGKPHSVRQLLEVAFGLLDLDYRDYVRVDQRFLRPADVNQLVGDATKAREKLGWEPSVTFEELVEMMVETDLAALKRST